MLCRHVNSLRAEGLQYSYGNVPTYGFPLRTGHGEPRCYGTGTSPACTLSPVFSPKPVVAECTRSDGDVPQGIEICGARLALTLPCSGITLKKTQRSTDRYGRFIPAGLQRGCLSLERMGAKHHEVNTATPSLAFSPPPVWFLTWEATRRDKYCSVTPWRIYSESIKTAPCR